MYKITTLLIEKIKNLTDEMIDKIKKDDENVTAIKIENDLFQNNKQLKPEMIIYDNDFHKLKGFPRQEEACTHNKPKTKKEEAEAYEIFCKNGGDPNNFDAEKNFYHPHYTKKRTFDHIFQILITLKIGDTINLIEIYKSIYYYGKCLGTDVIYIKWDSIESSANENQPPKSISFHIMGYQCETCALKQETITNNTLTEGKEQIYYDTNNILRVKRDEILKFSHLIID